MYQAARHIAFDFSEARSVLRAIDAAIEELRGVGLRLSLHVIALVMALMMSGCGPQEDQMQDHTGTTQDQIQDLSIHDQYELAEQRYLELQELAGEVQSQIHDGDWAAPSVGSEINPRMGSSLGRAPEGATKNNSYYFDVFRTYAPAEDEDLHDIIRQTSDDWADRGWQISIEKIDNRTFLNATTSDHYWFELAENTHNDQLHFRGHSPVYWVTDYMELGRATQQRREAQNEAADEWPVADQSSETRRLFQPGEHRPFPAWEIID